jgi:hypothetical protein
MEALLESFYGLLGSQWLTTQVKETYIRRGKPTQTPVSQQLEALIKERAPLMFYDYQHGERDRITRDCSWLIKYLAVYEVPEIVIRREFVPKRAVHTQPTSACVDSGSSRCNLYMSRQDFDYYDVANTLGKVLFTKCRLNDALLLSTLLSASLENLRRKGFPVERILNTPKPVPKPRADTSDDAVMTSKGSRLPERLLDIYSQQLIDIFPDCDPDYIRERLRREKDDHVRRVADHLSSINYPKATPRVVGEDDEDEEEKKSLMGRGHKRGASSTETGPTGALGRISRLFGWGGSTTPVEPVKEDPAPPPARKAKTVNTIDPNMYQRLERSLKSAIDSCRPNNSSVITSDSSITQVTESTVSYCDPQHSHRLQQVECNTPLAFYLDRDLKPEDILNDARLMRSLQRFNRLLIALCNVFGLNHKSAHVYYDVKAETIAFNNKPTHSLFFNLHFFDVLHFREPKAGVDESSIKESFTAYVYWYMTFCHELAHNFCTEHSAQHEVSHSVVVAVV